MRGFGFRLPRAGGGRRRWRWPTVISLGGGGPGGPRREAGEAGGESARAPRGGRDEGGRAPAWTGFGLAVAALTLLLLVSLLLPSGLVAVEGPVDPQPLQVGQDALYRLTLVNQGRVPVWVRGVRLDVAAPLWLVGPADAPAERPPVVAAGRRQVLVPLGAFLLPGEERTVALRIRPLEPGELVVRHVRLEFAQLLDPRVLELATPALSAAVDAPPAAEPTFAEHGRFGRSVDARGYRLLRVEGKDDGDVARLTFVFAAPAGEDEPPGFVAGRDAEGGIELLVAGTAVPRSLRVRGEVASLQGLDAERTEEGDVRIRIAVPDLVEYRAFGLSQPPRIVVEWRAGDARGVQYRLRVPPEHEAVARAVVAALASVSPPVEPVGEGREDDAWVVSFDRRYAADRVAQALRAAGAEVEVEVQRPAR